MAETVSVDQAVAQRLDAQLAAGMRENATLQVVLEQVTQLALDAGADLSGVLSEEFLAQFEQPKKKAAKK